MARIDERHRGQSATMACLCAERQRAQGLRTVFHATAKRRLINKSVSPGACRRPIPSKRRSRRVRLQRLRVSMLRATRVSVLLAPAIAPARARSDPRTATARSAHRYWGRSSCSARRALGRGLADLWRAASLSWHQCRSKRRFAAPAHVPPVGLYHRETGQHIQTPSANGPPLQTSPSAPGRCWPALQPIVRRPGYPRSCRQQVLSEQRGLRSPISGNRLRGTGNPVVQPLSSSCAARSHKRHPEPAHV